MTGIRFSRSSVTSHPPDPDMGDISLGADATAVRPRPARSRPVLAASPSRGSRTCTSAAGSGIGSITGCAPCPTGSLTRIETISSPSLPPGCRCRRAKTMRNCCDITGPARPVLHAYRFFFARTTLRKFLRRRRYDGCWKMACSMSEWRSSIATCIWGNAPRKRGRPEQWLRSPVCPVMRRSRFRRSPSPLRTMFP
jgi:hypothetical protein